MFPKENCSINFKILTYPWEHSNYRIKKKKTKNLFLIFLPGSQQFLEDVSDFVGREAFLKLLQQWGNEDIPLSYL